MKKYLLLILTMLSVSIGAWAQATFSNDYKGAYITTNGEGNLTVTAIEENASNFQWVNYVIVTGNVNNADIANLASATYSIDGNNMGGATIDFSGVTTVGDVTFIAKSAFKGIKLPTGYDLASYSGPQTFAFYVDGSDAYLRILDSENALADIKKLSVSCSWANAPFSGKTVYLSGDYGSFDDVKTFLKDGGNAGATEVVKVVPVSNDPYTVDGCNVSINTAKVTDGSTVAKLLQLAKADVLEGGQSNICTLTVAGEITNQDLAALADAAMTGATRIDLSAATLASGASIDNLRVPTSLTQLVLPCDQTVSSTLANRLAAVTGLDYAYSPSSDAQRLGASSTGSYDGTKNKIADYVWVVKAGGLAQAFTNEEWLRNSFYIKVASSVALNATDVNFNALDTNKPTNYLFLDFSGSNLTPEMVANYRVTDQIGYRIILPDNWGVDDLATFAAMPTANIGSLAAVYSYTGTTLKIMEITDGSYAQTALKNPRIVRPGTTAIEVVGKLEENGGNWYQRGDLGSNLIAALNQADDDPDNDAVNNIKTININVGQANTILTTISFTNTNIEHFTMAGVKNKNNPNTGPGVDVSGCTNLQTIDVSNSTLQLLDAHGLTNLTSVDMSGTLMTNANGLSGETILTGCTSLTTSGFVTTNTTQFIKDLKLINTGLTSFATPAKVTGDIYLNASSSLTSVDLTQTDFQNSTSMIHIDKETTEGTEALAALARTEIVGDESVAVKTIFVPNEFASSTRIHPYDAVKNNIGEAAGSSAGADGDDCSITYDATTKIATVHTNEPGHFATMMASAYASYPQGTTFKFDATSKINMADLQALAGTINANDYSWRSNYYYVDLYDLPASAALCDNTTGVIGQTISWLRTNNRQFKGLILPKNHTLYGSGTTLIQDAEGADPAVATCSEFIAYYKTKEMVSGTATDQPNQLLVAHVYNQSNSSSAYQDSYDKMMSLLNLHTEIANDADIYSISTNSINKIDISDLPAAATEIEIVNNEMVGTATTANVYVYPDEAGHFATAVNATGLKSTPTELMKIEGPINSGDITAINAFDTNSTADKVNGPRVLDLSAATGVTKALVASLTNKDIEYIILPAGMTKDDVCDVNNYSALTSLKAVISSSNTNLVAYVKQAGSLAEARYYATGGSITGNIFTPTQTGLQSVTLAGNLNASDIAANTTAHYVDANGHWAATGGNLSSLGLGSEQGTITTIDLKDAEFLPTQEDMNFSYAGLSSLHSITLPTSEDMTLIPADCFEGITSFDDLCIPYNYTKIDNRALHGTYCSHITTTDANGALVDNGARTYTFSANLQYIGSEPTPDANGVYALTETVFPQNRGVTDVYVLAHKTPKCYANAFPANMLYGWGGFKGGNFPYCREKYDNSSDGSLIFTVLHFPDEASFDATDADKKDTSYDLMKKQYTDVNKVYSMKEQTGAVDANGDVITWPTFSELRRTYNQATNGMTWNDWNVTYDTNHEVNGGDNIPTTSQPAGSGAGDYAFPGYEGWHQFTLAMATYVEPEKTVENNIIVNEYVKTDRWYTFCIPYSITADQLKEVLGVPASTDKVKSRVYKSDGTTVLENECSTGHNPEARTLHGVKRQPGTSGGKNQVELQFTVPMVTDGSETYFYWNINETTPNSSAQAVCGNTEKNKVIAMRGGLPYIVKPYLPKGVTVNNLGQYVMQRFAATGKFTEDQACANLGTDFYEQLGNRNKVTSRFVKPYEKHKIQAFKDNGPSGNTWYTHTDGKKYYYAFVGQFWEQDLPQYSLYVVNGKWYRYASGNKGYKLAPYKCVVMASQEDDTDTKLNSGKYRSAVRSNIPTVTTELKDDDIFDSTFYLGFLDGLDDESFDEGSAAARETNYIFSLDGDIVEFDENGEMVTGIDNLDGVDLKPAISDGKIYNMTGQYVGTSLEGLTKGMYIMNGQKFVVK